MTVITEDSMTVGEVESLLENTKHNAFPVVVSRENSFLVGSVLRRDLLLALGTSFKLDTQFVYLTIQLFVSLRIFEIK